MTQTDTQPAESNNNTIKVEKSKSGQIVRADKASNKQPRKPALKLTCVVTGKTRPTNMKYLQAKALKHGVTVEEIMASYVSKEGKIVVLDGTNHPDRERILRLNGRTSKKA
jgi:hypothetical protein